MFNKIWQFVKDVRVEFTKVSWPSRDELVQSTVVVIVVSLVVATFIGVIDRLLSVGVTFFLGRF
jgi:preprotein translocase subunit SecE